MTSLIKRKVWDISFPRSRGGKWLAVGVLAVGGYVAFKAATVLLSLAWTVATWFFWPAVVYFAYLAIKNYRS